MSTGIFQQLNLPVLCHSCILNTLKHFFLNLSLNSKECKFEKCPLKYCDFDQSICPHYQFLTHPPKNCDVIYGPPLGLILTYMNVLCIWMYIRALSEFKFKLSNQDGWFIKSQKVSIENGYEENTWFKFLPYLKLKYETSILLLI